MPLFGSKDKIAKKSVDNSGSKSLGTNASQNAQSGRNDFVTRAPVRESPPALPTRNSQRGNSVNNARTEVVGPGSSKTFAAELDGSTISSLTQSQRDAGSVSGSQPTTAPSTTATSVTNRSPTDQSQKEAVIPDQPEKEIAGSEGLIHNAKGTNSRNPSNLKGVSDLPEVSNPNQGPSTDTQKEVDSPSQASGVFSLPLTNTSTTSRLYREFNFYNCNNFKDLVICDSTQKPMLFAEVFSHTRSKSDVMLHDLSKVSNLPSTNDITSKVVANVPVSAFADYVPNEIASQIRLGIGDPLDPAACVWVMMKNIQRDASTGMEKFDMTVSGAGGIDITFQWVKNAANDTETSDESSAKEAYRLIQGEETIASFRNAGAMNMRKRGALRVYEVPMAEQYLLLILLSASAMSEMYRRRRTKKMRKAFLIPF